MSPHIEKMLVASTCHLPRECADQLDAAIPTRAAEAPIHQWGAIVYPHGPYGWKFFVSNDAEISSPLAKLAALARDNQCDWILLDRDAAPLDDLDQFDW